MFVLPLTRSVTHRAAMPGFGRSLDRLFQEARDRQTDAGPGDAQPRMPAMDVTESDTHYTVLLDMPGVTREQLTVSVEGRRVSVESAPANRAEAAATEGASPAEGAPKVAARVLYRERSAMRYARTVSLPAEVDQSTSQAKVENGVLTLTLAKKVAAGATQISVN